MAGHSERQEATQGPTDGLVTCSTHTTVSAEKERGSKQWDYSAIQNELPSHEKAGRNLKALSLSEWGQCAKAIGR